MRAVDIIMKKRGFKGNPIVPLSHEEIAFFINGYVAGEIPDYQMAALLMAVFFNGMTFEETADLTDIMLKSGARMDLSGIEGPFVDKHSTGGVGDKISLPLAPIVAACDIKVPMMSGRALGHTGGTLDKLEAIDGYKTGLSVAQFRSYISKIGFAMTGQTKEIVPADRLIYALRDVTGTVESIPLITASILSKKVAEGADALVFDVKCGKGAFMKTAEQAEALAKSLVGTGTSMGKKVIAVITAMTDPLGYAVGNFLEIEETLAILDDCGPKDTTDLTLQLAAWMLVLGGKAASKEEGIQKAHETIQKGTAKALFLENIKLQGGDPQAVLAQCGKRRSPYSCIVTAPRDGFIKSIDAYQVGIAGVHLGVGRNKTTDSVCPDAGIILKKHAGDAVKQGDTLMEVYGKDAACLVPASDILQKAVTYADKPPVPQTLIIKEITADNL